MFGRKKKRRPRTKRRLPFHKPSDKDAARDAYTGRAKINRRIGDKNAYIQKQREVAKDYVANGMMETAKPIVSDIAKAEEDKDRLLKYRSVFDRVIAKAERSDNDSSLEELTEGLVYWLRSKGEKIGYGDEMGDLIDGLNDLEATDREADDAIDQIQGNQSNYENDRADAILEELQAEVNARKEAARALDEEADGEKDGEPMPI